MILSSNSVSCNGETTIYFKINAILALLQSSIVICNDMVIVPACLNLSVLLSIYKKKRGRDKEAGVRKTPLRACCLFFLQYFIGKMMWLMEFQDSLKLNCMKKKLLSGLQVQAKQHTAFTFTKSSDCISSISKATSLNFYCYLVKFLIHI